MSKCEKCGHEPESVPKMDVQALGTYVQRVPEHCDRILWRGRYYHLPLPGDSVANAHENAPPNGETGK